MTRKRFIIGIDEAGRGPLAGPIVIAAVAIPAGFRPRRRPLSLRDSKKLTAIQKQAWFEYITSHPRILYTTARAYPRRIDCLNVARAANQAANRAFHKLINSRRRIINKASVFLDGGLYLNEKGSGSTLKPQTLIRGDQKINAIKLASIVAKVSRDQYMTKLHKKYPQYGFDCHKGYGTKKHKGAIRKYGPCKAHRLTFI